MYVCNLTDVPYVHTHNGTQQKYCTYCRVDSLCVAAPTPQASDADSVAVLMTVFGDPVLPHWLAVLSNFPETTSPAVYVDILPDKRYVLYVCVYCT